MRKPRPQANGHDADASPNGTTNGASSNGAPANGMTANGATSNGAPANGVTANGVTANGSGPVEDAEALRETLKMALSQTTALIASLKLHRQQTRKFRSAVQSLRELQAIDA